MKPDLWYFSGVFLCFPCFALCSAFKLTWFISGTSSSWTRVWTNKKTRMCREKWWSWPTKLRDNWGITEGYSPTTNRVNKANFRRSFGTSAWGSQETSTCMSTPWPWAFVQHHLWRKRPKWIVFGNIPNKMGVSENSVPHCTQWFSWSLSLLNGYNWGYTLFSDKPRWMC